MDRDETIKLLTAGAEGVERWNRRREHSEVLDTIVRPDLEGADLSGAVLSGANLAKANMGQAKLIDADLSEADLSGALLLDSDLTGAELSKANLVNADLSRAKLIAANLRDARGMGAVLFNANLCGANLRVQDFRGADLREADLRGAKLSTADLRRANFIGADLSKADLNKTDLSGAILNGANLRWADLAEANLSGARLEGTKLSRANLNGVNLSDVDVNCASFREAEFSKEEVFNQPTGRVFRGPNFSSDNPTVLLTKAIMRRAALFFDGLLSRCRLLDWLLADPVDCTVFSPPSVARSDWLSVLVFVHRPDQHRETTALAHEIDQQAVQRAFKSLEVGIRPGSVVMFHIHVPGFEFPTTTERLVWPSRPVYVHFLGKARSETPVGTAIGNVTVSRDGVPVGSITFRVEIVAENQRPIAANALFPDTAAKRRRSLLPSGERVRRYKKAFISYASKDRPEVLKRVQMLRLVRIRYFHDLLKLEPGADGSANSSVILTAATCSCCSGPLMLKNRNGSSRKPATPLSERPATISRLRI